MEEEKAVGAEQVPSELVVLPLYSTVIFPKTVVPVILDNPEAIRAIKHAQKARFVATFMVKEKERKRLAGERQSQTDGSKESKRSRVGRKKLYPADLYSLGTACLILKTMPVSKGAMVVALQGISKIKALEWEFKKDHLTVRAQPIEEAVPFNGETEPLCKSLINTAQKVIAKAPFLPREMAALLEELVEEPLRLLYTVTTFIRLKPTDQQRLLKIADGKKKFRYLIELLSRELELIALGGKIETNVKKEFNKMQREVFLRQRLKAIKKELGDDDDPMAGEVNELKEQMKKAKLPTEAKKATAKEIKRLEMMHPMSGEYQIIRTYLDWILELPWKKLTKDNLNLKRAQKILDEDHYGLKEIKERLIEHLAVRKLRQDMKSPILCFVGPPGVGKTSLGKSIARALRREFVRISLGGMRDEAEIRGHRRTYIGALPGRIIQAIRRADSRNPVFMLDEIDKVGADFRGDPSAALLEVLDPEQNSTFRDHYLDLDFDLSQVMFIATANVLDTLRPALHDRMEIIEIAGYSDEEKLHIAKKFLLPRQVREHGLTKQQIKFDDAVLKLIISQYTKEAGVRNLEREIAKVIRKVAKKVAQGKQGGVSDGVGEKITTKRIAGFLGPQKVFPEVKRRVSTAGVATGLGVTSVGGDIIFVEATQMPGDKKFTLTGNLGDVMKESANAALSLVRSRAEELGVSKDFYRKSDLHLHVPAGAVPKDGPSAGVTMLTALASLLSNRKARNDLAMTGEITLSGLVIPVGGIKQKVLAARRGGIKTVILPKGNKGELEEIDEQLKEGMEFIFVETVDEVLAAALLPANK